MAIIRLIQGKIVARLPGKIPGTEYMSLFDSLSTPKWQHRKAEVRLLALAELQDQEVLLTLVRSDPDDSVRSAALARIETPQTLDMLIETLPADLQQQARQQRLQQLLPDRAQLAIISDDALLLRIAELSDDENLSSDAIARISDRALRLQIAGTHPLARIRLNASTGIADLAALRELMQLTRGRDKRVYRHCKSRLDAHDAQQQIEAQREHKIQQLLNDAQELIGTTQFAEIKGRYLALQQKWKGIAEFATSTEVDRFKKLMETCERHLAEALQARDAQEQALAAAETTHMVQESLLTELQSWTAVAGTPESSEAIDQMKRDLLKFGEGWQAATVTVTARQEINRAFTGLLTRWQAVCDSAQKLAAQKSRIGATLLRVQKTDYKDYQGLQKDITQVEKLLARLPWPEDLTIKRPEHLQQLHQSLDELRTGLDTLKSNQSEHVKHVATLVQKLKAALEENQTKEADKALNKVRKALTSMEPGRREPLEQQIKPLAARLHEAHDWQGFAIEPKKHELCASMEALIGSNEDAEMLAVKIQTLQEQWKRVGALPHTQEQELWLRFKAASDEAWKPCKEAFAQQARLHRDNLKKRMQVVTQLSAYDRAIAWPDALESDDPGNSNQPRPGPAWSLVQKTLDAAREEFRRIQPVDPKAARQSQKAFREICDRIYGHISSEYERNIVLKEQLVDRAQKLAAQDDLPKSIELAKRLQQEWKAVGITPVKADRKLWQAFRAACDAVFQRLDEQRAQDKSNASAQIQQAEALREQAHTLMQSRDAEPGAQQVSALADLKQQLYGLELPAAVQQRILKDFQALEKQARERIQQAKANREKASWATLIESMQAAATGSASASDAGGHGSHSSTAADNLPKGIDATALMIFLQQGPGNTAEESLREACIALEVLTEMESPAADKQARMNYQMQRLVKGIGRADVNVEQTLLAQINEFIAMRPGRNWMQRYCAVLIGAAARSPVAPGSVH